MRRLALPLVLVAASSACVSVAPPPDPVGVYQPGQRLVVLVYQSPGPWIPSDSDSKLESASKILPVGFAVQGLQDQHTLTVSKHIEEFLPRPRYDEEFQKTLLAEIRANVSTAPVQTGLEAGISPEQIQRWNRSRDQLDWRLRYYSPDPQNSAPRDYSQGYGLDDALVLDANLSYGTMATDEGAIHPYVSASWRVYRGLNSREVWEHVDDLADAVSTTTLVDIQSSPADFTARLELLAPALGKAVGHEFVRAFGLLPSTAPARGGAPHGLLAGGASGPVKPGLLPLEYLLSLSSGNASGAPPPAPAPIPAPPAGTSISTTTAAGAAPPAVAPAVAVSSAPAGVAVSTAAAAPLSAPPAAPPGLPPPPPGSP